VGCFWAGDVTLNDEWDEVFRKSAAKDAIRPKVVVLGTGWAAASFVKKLDLSLYDVTVVSPRNYFLFTPMLAGSTVGTVEQRSIIEPIRSLLSRCNAADAQYLQAECTAVDSAASKITCVDSSVVQGDVKEFEVPYDHLVIACGAEAATYGTPGVHENACFMKELGDSVKIRNQLADCLETACLPGQSEEAIDRLLHFIVVGGGPSGVEFAAELHDFLKNDVTTLYPHIPKDRIKISLFDVMPHILGMFDSKLVEYSESTLRREGIDLRTSTKVSEIKPQAVSLVNSDGRAEEVPFGLLVWVAGITTRPLVNSVIQSIEAQTDRRGLMVDAHLKVKGSSNIYAIGDCAISGNPPTAQVASQEGRYLGRLLNTVAPVAQDCMVQKTSSANLDQAMGQQSDFHYCHKGSFAYIGDQRALAQVPNVAGNENSEDHQISGQAVYIAWRTVYFSKLLSTRNRMMVGLDWAKTKLFGRDTSRV